MELAPLSHTAKGNRAVTAMLFVRTSGWQPMAFDDPFDASRQLNRSGCSCGSHASAEEHDRALGSPDAQLSRVVASAIVRALFPEEQSRRTFLRAVGASTALAAISQFFPLGTATEVFAQAATPEKKDLKVGFIPITCATPIIMAHPMGLLHEARPQRRGGEDSRLGGGAR